MGKLVVHITQGLDKTTLERLAEFICGDDNDLYPVYRSSSYLTKFFQDININVTHDGTTRKWWVLAVLNSLTSVQLEGVILRLVSPYLYGGMNNELKKAIGSMNDILFLEEFAVDYDGKTPILVKSNNINIDIRELDGANTDEDSFLNRKFDDDLNIEVLGISDVKISDILQDRINELRSGIKKSAPLSAIFIMGSTMEGMMLGCLLKDPAKYKSSVKAPKDKAGKIKQIYDWRLYDMIEVAHDCGTLGDDVRKFSHVLRDFRNYIHPYQQSSKDFRPDSHTVDICWHVFKAAFHDLKGDV